MTHQPITDGPRALRTSPAARRPILLVALLLLLVPACSGERSDRTIPTSAASPSQSDHYTVGALGLAAPAETVSRTDTPAVRLDPWSFASYPGWLISTPSYRIHTTIEHERVRDRLPRFMEAALQRYTTALADLPAPREPMDAFIFHDRRQWTAKARELLPDQQDMIDRLGRGGFATQGLSVLYYIDRGGRDRDTFSITAHEGWHQYTQRTFRNSLPIWLEEGIATWMEGHQFRGDSEPVFLPHLNWERRYALRRGVRARRLIPMEDLLSHTPQHFLSRSKEDLLLYYGQVWALTRFLVEYDDGRYRPVLATILQDAAAGRLDATLLRSPMVIAAGGRRHIVSGAKGRWLVLAYLHDDLSAFEAEYRAFVERIAG